MAPKYRYAGQTYTIGSHVATVKTGVRVHVDDMGEYVGVMDLDPDIARGGAKIIDVVQELKKLPVEFWLDAPPSGELWNRLLNNKSHKQYDFLREECPWLYLLYSKSRWRSPWSTPECFSFGIAQHGRKFIRSSGPIYKLRGIKFAGILVGSSWAGISQRVATKLYLDSIEGWGIHTSGQELDEVRKEFGAVWNRIRLAVVRKHFPSKADATKIKKAVAREKLHLKHRTNVLTAAEELRAMLDQLEASVKEDTTTREFLGSFYYSSMELCQTLTNWKSAVRSRIPKDDAALEVMKRKNVLDVMSTSPAEPKTSSDKDAK